MTNVAQFTAGRMTAEQYEKERTTLREAYGDSKKEAGTRWEQELARLFARSGWTQAELAKKEGKSNTWVCRRLNFGKFLNFFLNMSNAESVSNALHFVNLEAFMRYWERAGDASPTKSYNERQRFIEIRRMMSEEMTLRQKDRPSILRDIVEQFGDGQWHAVETMAEKLDTTIDHISQTLKSMNSRSSRALSERKRVGKSFHHRIFKKERAVSLDELTTKLKPIIKGLQAEGRKSIVTMSPPTVAHLAHQLAELLDEWMGDPSADGTTQERSGSKRARRTDDVSSD